MKIDLREIFAQLEEWRVERKIKIKSEKENFLVNVMGELGELSYALKDHKKFSQPDYPYVTDIDIAKEEIIVTLCWIAIYTIHAGADIPSNLKHSEIELEKPSLNADYILKQLIEKCAEFAYYDWDEAKCFNIILANCAYLCRHYGYDFKIAMDETIKEISSRTGFYDEAREEWIEDASWEAQTKWYEADYKIARLHKNKKG